MRTRCMDKNRTPIWEGDILHVEEYPDKYVGCSLDFEGVVTIENGRAMVIYNHKYLLDLIHTPFYQRFDRFSKPTAKRYKLRLLLGMLK